MEKQSWSQSEQPSSPIASQIRAAKKRSAHRNQLQGYDVSGPHSLGTSYNGQGHFQHNYPGSEEHYQRPSLYVGHTEMHSTSSVQSDNVGGIFHNAYPSNLGGTCQDAYTSTTTGVFEHANAYNSSPQARALWKRRRQGLLPASECDPYPDETADYNDERFVNDRPKPRPIMARNHPQGVPSNEYGHNQTPVIQSGETSPLAARLVWQKRKRSQAERILQSNGTVARDELSTMQPECVQPTLGHHERNFERSNSQQLRAGELVEEWGHIQKRSNDPCSQHDLDMLANFESDQNPNEPEGYVPWSMDNQGTEVGEESSPVAREMRKKKHSRGDRPGEMTYCGWEGHPDRVDPPMSQALRQQQRDQQNSYPSTYWEQPTEMESPMSRALRNSSQQRVSGYEEPAFINSSNQTVSGYEEPPDASPLSRALSRRRAPAGRISDGHEGIQAQQNYRPNVVSTRGYATHYEKDFEQRNLHHSRPGELLEEWGQPRNTSYEPCSQEDLDAIAHYGSEEPTYNPQSHPGQQSEAHPWNLDNPEVESEESSPVARQMRKKKHSRDGPQAPTYCGWEERVDRLEAPPSQMLKNHEQQNSFPAAEWGESAQVSRALRETRNQPLSGYEESADASSPMSRALRARERLAGPAGQEEPADMADSPMSRALKWRKNTGLLQ